MIIFTDPTHKRNRTLTWWNVHSSTNGTYLSGIVSIKGNEPPLVPGAQFRVTYTSIIKNVNKNIVTTESGSTYTLIGEPRQPLYYNYNYNPENPLDGAV